jgi:nucleoside-diphosphate-sugar epimerase
LITGATGLLGEYLLRDLSRLDWPLAVVARRSGRRSASARIEDIYAKLERSQRRALRRPIVLEGDLHQPLLGLDRAALDWVAEHCDTLLHNAASLQFIRDEKTGEPYRSNVEGTRHMLELCRRGDIRHLHHVSTAYVCGSRRGRIGERDPLDLTAASNDYERSKIEAEQLVRDHEPLESRVIYRPAIIVGDHRSGYTSTFHGFYVPLQLGHAIHSADSGAGQIPPQLLLAALGLSGEESKNFVPVDWVSAAITRSLCDPDDRFRGRTVHLAPRRRVSVSEMTSAILEALVETPPKSAGAASALGAANPERLLEFFSEQMQVYQAYWRDDPEFASDTADELLTDLPCPDVDRGVLLRLCRYALRTNFGARRERPLDPPSRLAETLAAPLAGSPAGPASGTELIGCTVTGPGGLDFAFAAGDAATIRQGIPVAERPQLRLHRGTWDRLLAGNLTPEAAVRRGCVAIRRGAAEQSAAATTLDPPAELRRLLQRAQSRGDSRSYSR